MAIRQEEKEAEERGSAGEEKYEMKFLGLNIKDLSDNVKLAYVGIFAVVVCGALWYGLTQLDNKQEKVSNKRRKSPKKDAKKDWSSLLSYHNSNYKYTGGQICS